MVPPMWTGAAKVLTLAGQHVSVAAVGGGGGAAAVDAEGCHRKGTSSADLGDGKVG